MVEQESEVSQLLSENAENDANVANNVHSEEISYALNAFYATILPVLATIILTTLAVTYVVLPLNANEDHNKSNNQMFEKGAANAVVFVGIMTVLTFAIVFLYWMRCMCFLSGYMVFTSFSLLFAMGGLFFFTFLQRFGILMDIFTFFFLLFNFSVVGIIAIFYQKGIPTFVTQGYLVCTSVLMAWQMSSLDDWTVWTLLIALALYDLFAVLSPCGPLRALILLMQQRPESPLPGLLYEADVDMVYQSTSDTAAGATANPCRRLSVAESCESGAARQTHIDKDACEHEQQITASDTSTLSQSLSHSHSQSQSQSFTEQSLASHTSSSPSRSMLEMVSPLHSKGELDVASPPMVNLMILQLLDTPYHSNNNSSLTSVAKPNIDSTDSPEAAPNNIELQSEQQQSGRQRRRARHTTSYRETIKLGVGDFVFYSVLASRAAMSPVTQSKLHGSGSGSAHGSGGFAPWLACVIVIALGLGATLLLLSVHHQALPALPISIFLGVAFYFLVSIFLVPFTFKMLQDGIYI